MLIFKFILFQDIPKELFYEKIDEILKEDPDKILTYDQIRSKLETILCSDFSKQKQTIKNYIADREYVPIVVAPDTSDKKDQKV